MLHIQPFTFNPFQENTYLLYNDRGSCIIIDPGCSSPAERDRLASFIDQKGLRPRLLINTHCHIDHVLGLEFIFRSYGLTLHMHEADQPVLDHAPAAGLMFGVPFENFTGAVSYLEDGSIVRLDDDELKIIFTPGHSPGSISLYNESQGFLISGDVLFNRSIGRTDLPGGDYDTLIASIRNRLFVLPDQTRVYSGHGPSTTIGEEKNENPFVAG
jgi:glyoxylase-like metal-dependent hydrolase (beta-lactamase superfamily II)